MEPADLSMLGDDELGAMASAAPLRTPARGKADIGGRIRVASILKQAGLVTTEAPERIAGSTNEVWRAGDYVVRVGLTPGADRLRREAKLAEHLPPQVQYPKVIAAGLEPFGEWIVVRHRRGLPLSHEWASMGVVDRRSAIHDLAHCVRAIHALQLPPELAFDDHEGQHASHQLPVERMVEVLDQLSDRTYLDRGLLQAARERIEETRDALPSDEPSGLVHGDLHLENVMSMNGIVVALLDFEWCRQGPPEIDIDVLARFCAEPEIHIGGAYSVDKAEFRHVLRWMCEATPELFERERLRERLFLCALAFELPSLLLVPPTRPAAKLPRLHPVNRLKDLLNYGTHAERLGWDPTATV